MFSILALLAAINYCSVAAPNTAPQISRGIPEISPFIVGGSAVNITDAPYMCSLTFLIVGGVGYCGCVLLNGNWILTAAHCLVSYGIQLNVVRVGSNFYNSGGSIRIPLLSTIVSHVHPNYSATTIENDIALIHIILGFTESTTIQFMALPSDEPATSTVCTVYGWGLTSTNGSQSTQLLKTQATIMDRDDCANAYVTVNPVTDSMLCTDNAGNTGPCNGDSGGPLICNNTVSGLVSWGGDECAIPAYPSVYTNVFYFLEWIHNVTGII